MQGGRGREAPQLCVLAGKHSWPASCFHPCFALRCTSACSLIPAPGSIRPSPPLHHCTPHLQPGGRKVVLELVPLLPLEEVFWGQQLQRGGAGRSRGTKPGSAPERGIAGGVQEGR